jgi:hypothetical protein
MNKRDILLSTIFISLCVFDVAAQDTATVRRNTPSGVEIGTFKEIPAATQLCDAAACDWWERLRKSGNKMQKTPDAKSKSNFVNIFVEGLEKGFPVPVGDRPAQVLVPARVTEIDRLPDRERNGTVKLLVELRPDASIGEVKIMQKLGPHIDQLCMQAAQNILFLPAIKDGKFVTDSQPQTYGFFHSATPRSGATIR